MATSPSRGMVPWPSFPSLNNRKRSDFGKASASRTWATTSWRSFVCGCTRFTMS